MTRFRGTGLNCRTSLICMKPANWSQNAGGGLKLWPRGNGMAGCLSQFEEKTSKEPTMRWLLSATVLPAAITTTSSRRLLMVSSGYSFRFPGQGRQRTTCLFAIWAGEDSA